MLHRFVAVWFWVVESMGREALRSRWNLRGLAGDEPTTRDVFSFKSAGYDKNYAGFLEALEVSGIFDTMHYGLDDCIYDSCIFFTCY